MSLHPEVATLGEPRALRREDLPRAIAAVTRAFAWHEPWGAWSLPDEETREATMHSLVERDIEAYLQHESAWTIGGACVTMWIPPGVPELHRGESRNLAAFGDQAPLLAEGDEIIAAMKPTEPHWYLDTIATEPELMRRGLGAKLLDHDLAIRDVAGDRCALDTHTPENVAFYERRGFEVIAEGKLPEGPDLFMMVRPPRQAR